MLHQFTETMVFIELLAGAVNGRAGRNDVSNGLACDGMSHRIGGPMAFSPLLAQ